MTSVYSNNTLVLLTQGRPINIACHVAIIINSAFPGICLIITSMVWYTWVNRDKFETLNLNKNVEFMKHCRASAMSAYQRRISALCKQAAIIIIKNVGKALCLKNRSRGGFYKNKSIVIVCSVIIIIQESAYSAKYNVSY